MSDTGIFKSSQAAAQASAEGISGLATAGECGLSLTISRTNLTVVDHIADLEMQLSSCNAEFMQLVVDDADSILKLAEFFADFDTEMSGNMDVR